MSLILTSMKGTLPSDLSDQQYIQLPFYNITRLP